MATRIARTLLPLILALATALMPIAGRAQIEVQGQGEVQVSLVKQDLLGATVGSTVVSSIYADFEETPDGVVLLYYTATNDTQNVFVASFDPSLKRRWVSDPLRARRGLLGPKLVVLKDRILVVAADDYKLWIVALDLRGQLLGSYHDPTAALGPGSTYFVAHDATRLLLGQPDRRGGDATHSAPDPSCTRVRILRF